MFTSSGTSSSTKENLQNRSTNKAVSQLLNTQSRLANDYESNEFLILLSKFEFLFSVKKLQQCAKYKFLKKDSDY